MPGFSFPSTKMDIGSSDEEVNMAAGNSVALGLPRGSHTPYICTRPAFSRPSMCTGWNQIDAPNAHHCLLLTCRLYSSCCQAGTRCNSRNQSRLWKRPYRTFDPGLFFFHPSLVRPGDDAVPNEALDDFIYAGGKQLCLGPRNGRESRPDNAHHLPRPPRSMGHPENDPRSTRVILYAYLLFYGLIPPSNGETQRSRWMQDSRPSSA